MGYVETAVYNTVKRSVAYLRIFKVFVNIHQVDFYIDAVPV